jgi:3-phenylpropionate/trans-cinnamate dioxygenase ferredoxin component
MAGFVTVGRSDLVAEGDTAAFEVEGHEIAVARVEGELFAFADVCSHRRCTLSTGELDGTSIECECHGSVFSIRTGEPENPPATEPIAVYPVQEQGGEIRIEL